MESYFSMTHELQEIVQKASAYQKQGIQNILATVVDLDGSSYRQPGVRMLISSNGDRTGAISGGCVEKEVQRRALSVFRTKKPEVITYDGRYRLGCEGLLYILLEPLVISENLQYYFSLAIEKRCPFKINSYYQKMEHSSYSYGSIIHFKDKIIALNSSMSPSENGNLLCYHQKLDPIFKLIILGGEHDANKLCQQACLLGWEVTVITNLKKEPKDGEFLGAKEVIAKQPENFTSNGINANTAVVIMNHNFSYDLRYLRRLSHAAPIYIGMLGAAKRREKLFDALLELEPEISEEFLEKIHTPAGIAIGAITPEEIALAIVAEILAVRRKKEVHSLKEITGQIHL